MGFNFPATPATGEIFQPPSGPTWQWDGEKWKGGQIAGPQKEQFFDLSGKTSQDIVVPTWAASCVLTGMIVNPGAATYSYLRMSADGTTFFSGASDYNTQYPYHGTGSGLYATQGQVAASIIQLTLGSDNTTVPHSFTADVSLRRAGSTAPFQARVYGKSYDSTAASLWRTLWMLGYCNAAGIAGVTQLKALRVALGSAAAMGAGSHLHVRWLGDDAQMPVGNSIVGNDGWNGSTTYVPGTTTLTQADDGKLFTMTCGASAVFTLPNIANVANGWRVLLSAASWATAFQTNYVEGGGATILYNGVLQKLGGNNRFVLLGMGEIFRIMKMDTAWLVECINSPDNLHSVVAGSTASGGSWANTVTTPSVLGAAGPHSMSPEGSGQTYNCGFVATVTGLYAISVQMVMSAEAIGGATAGHSMLGWGNAVSVQEFDDLYIWTTTGTNYRHFYRTLALQQGDVCEGFFWANVSTLLYQPYYNSFQAKLIRR